MSDDFRLIGRYLYFIAASRAICVSATSADVHKETARESRLLRSPRKFVEFDCYRNCQFSLHRSASHFLILSHQVSQVAEGSGGEGRGGERRREDSCNLMFWIKGNDAIAIEKEEGRAAQNSSKYRASAKKLWKLRPWRKVRITGSEMQIMAGAIIQRDRCSLLLQRDSRPRSPWSFWIISRILIW